MSLLMADQDTTEQATSNVDNSMSTSINTSILVLVRFPRDNAMCFKEIFPALLPRIDLTLQQPMDQTWSSAHFLPPQDYAEIGMKIKGELLYYINGIDHVL